jgi:hypothetical protein
MSYNFNFNFDFDGIEAELAAIKDQVHLERTEEGILISVDEPSIIEGPVFRNLLDEHSFTSLQSLFGGSSNPGFRIEVLDSGVKIETKDPTGLLEVVTQMLDPTFMANLMAKIVDMVAQQGRQKIIDELDFDEEDEDVVPGHDGDDSLYNLGLGFGPSTADGDEAEDDDDEDEEEV